MSWGSVRGHDRVVEDLRLRHVAEVTTKVRVESLLRVLRCLAELGVLRPERRDGIGHHVFFLLGETLRHLDTVRHGERPLFYVLELACGGIAAFRLDEHVF